MPAAVEKKKRGFDISLLERDVFGVDIDIMNEARC
jgi:hypothetical protein